MTSAAGRDQIKRPEASRQAEPSTDESMDNPIGGAWAAPGLPTVGVWVGPREEPARYERLEHVDGGVEGSIYRARYVGSAGGNPAEVALKEYRPSPGAPSSWPHDGTWLQISDQAALLASLRSSDHLVQIREVFLGSVSTHGLDGALSSTQKAFDTPFVVMEWIDGRSPAELMKSRKPALGVRLSWIRDLAEALERLSSVSRTYGNPLVHGDVKPANCLISAARGLVLVDTGAMHRADIAGNRRGLRSPPYAAPEVMANPGGRRTTAADLYSLGAVAFFLLTGVAPPTPQGDYMAEARTAMASSDCSNGSLSGTATARAIDHILRLLDPDPGVRAHTGALDWANALTDLLSPKEQRKRPHRRWRNLILAAWVAAGLGVAEIAWATAGPAAHAVDPLDAKWLYVHDDDYKVWLSMDGKSDGASLHADGNLSIFPGCINGQEAGQGNKGVSLASCTAHPAYLPDASITEVTMRNYLQQMGSGGGVNGEGKTINDLAELYYMKPAARRALFEAAANVPGIRVYPSTVTNNGTVAMAISWGFDDHTSVLLYNPKTLAYLGAQKVSRGEQAAITQIVVDRVGLTS